LASYLSLENADAGAQWIHIGEHIVLGVMAVAVAVAIRYSPGRRRDAEFRTTGMDALIVLVVITAILAIGWALPRFSGAAMTLLILLYAIEFLTSERRERPSRLGLGVTVFLVSIATKGLFF
jgi:heme A synthase